jgi:hypothetical protein
MGQNIDEAGFVEQAKQHQMEFNNKRPKSTIQIKTKVTLFNPKVVTYATMEWGLNRLRKNSLCTKGTASAVPYTNRKDEGFSP